MEDFALNAFLDRDNGIQLVSAFDKLEEALEKYEEERIAENSKRKSEDEKVSVKLPPVPLLEDEGLQKLLDEKRSTLIQEALGLHLYL